MKVNISYEEALFELMQLEPGDCFLYAGHVYMKTNYKDPNSIDIKTGVLKCFSQNVNVLPLEVTAINSSKEK